MSNDTQAASAGLRDFAEKSLEQARGAVGTLLAAGRKTADTIQETTKTQDSPEGQAVARGFGFAEQNIAAIFDFAQQLVRAPDLKEAARLQSDFVREQTRRMGEQVSELKDLRTTKSEGA